MAAHYWPDVFIATKFPLHVWAENDKEAREKIEKRMFNIGITPQMNEVICEWYSLGRPLGKLEMPTIPAVWW